MNVELDGELMIVSLDNPDESVNTLKAGFAPLFIEILERAEQEAKAVILISNKKDSFVAGADIRMLDAVKSASEGTQLSLTGHHAMEKMTKSPLPVVAAIHGTCLGGGLELVLAADARIATSAECTRLGLPEVQLGLLPGMGGTQRLPRLIGVTTALDMMLTGRQLDSRRALKAGLVDAVVPQTELLRVAKAKARELIAKAGSKTAWQKLKSVTFGADFKELALAENPLGRRLVFDQATRKIEEKTKGHYPAPFEILKIVRFGLERGMHAGLEAEAEAFGRLVESGESKALRHLFLSQTALKRGDALPNVEPVKIEEVGVLGAGLMGASISFVTAQNAGLKVRIKDLSEQALTRGLQQIYQLTRKLVERRKLSSYEARRLITAIGKSTSFAGFSQAQVIIEAAPESLELKRQLLKDVQRHGAKDVIFASNTSALPISQIAEGCESPERVVGMHYFSPVEKMPLLEVIETEQTAAWVTRTVAELGKKQGKTVIVVGDGPGFYTTRILAPFMNEATFILMEGARVEEIDESLVKAGFPVGPLALLDEVGIDVGAKVAQTMFEHFGMRMAPPPQLAVLVENGRIGRKAKKGFYDYASTKKKGPRAVDFEIYNELGLEVPGSVVETEPVASSWLHLDERAERCLMAMLNEAVRCLEEGVIRQARDADIGAIFGLGFPPFLGGPLFLIDQVGASKVLARIEALAERFGERFEPAQLLRDHAKNGTRFYP